MLERFENNTSGTHTPNREYFNQPATTKEFVAAKKFVENHLGERFSSDLTDTPENMKVLKEYLEKKINTLMPGSSVEGVIEELRKAEFVTPVIVEKVEKVKEVDFLPTQYVKVEESLKTVEMKEHDLKVLEANLLIEELEKANIFRNKEEFDNLYIKITESESNKIESEQYYYEFSQAGLIKGGDEEVQKDMEYLQQKENIFANKEITNSKEKERIEKAKKIATLTEYALAYGVSDLGWYGENVSITPASKFDDIRGGVDDILEIRKEDEESSFMALGIDVTFRGLYSAEFKDKLFKLLKSIDEGYKTKVKYSKNHNGEMMKEFAIPKMVLYFNIEDVRDLVHILQNVDDPSAIDMLKNNKQKFGVLQQIVQSCEKLASFAEKSQNNIFRKYVAVVNSLKELAWENPEIKEMIETQKDDMVSKHFDALIEEFKLTKRANTI